MLKHMYAAVATTAAKYYQTAMVGRLPAGYDVPWRKDALLQEETQPLDLSGGWLTGAALHDSLPHGFQGCSDCHRRPGCSALNSMQAAWLGT